MPLTATTAPSRSASTAAASASSPSASARAGRVAPRELRPALRARVGLRVEAPVGGIVVLGTAGGAHREAAHRRGRTVVRHAEHDRVARPAVRAVRERVAVPAVGGIVDLGQAVVAGGGVDAHRHRRGTRRVALHDREAGVLADAAAACSTVTVATRASGGGSSVRTRVNSAMRSGLALDVDEHARAVVADGAREPERDGVPVHERAEADALHGAGDAEQRARHRSDALSRCGGAGRRRACRRCGSRRRWCGAPRCLRARPRSRR